MFTSKALALIKPNPTMIKSPIPGRKTKNAISAPFP